MLDIDSTVLCLCLQIFKDAVLTKFIIKMGVKNANFEFVLSEYTLKMVKKDKLHL